MNALFGGKGRRGFPASLEFRDHEKMAWGCVEEMVSAGCIEGMALRTAA
jgi:hypothetical protein